MFLSATDVCSLIRLSPLTRVSLRLKSYWFSARLFRYDKNNNTRMVAGKTQRICETDEAEKTAYSCEE